MARSGSAVRDYLTHGGLADPLLVFMAVEFVVLGRQRRWRRDAVADAAFALAPGASLALALRAALKGGAWPWTAVFLAATLPLHLADMRRRQL